MDTRACLIIKPATASSLQPQGMFEAVHANVKNCSVDPVLDKRLAVQSITCRCMQEQDRVASEKLLEQAIAMLHPLKMPDKYLTRRRAGGFAKLSSSSNGQSYTTRSARPDLPSGKRLCSFTMGLGRNCAAKRTSNYHP